MTATAMLDLKQRVSRLTKSERRVLKTYMDRLRNDVPRRRSARVKMQRDASTGLPYFTPPQGTPPLSLAEVKRVMRDFP